MQLLVVVHGEVLKKLCERHFRNVVILLFFTLLALARDVL